MYNQGMYEFIRQKMDGASLYNVTSFLHLKHNDMNSLLVCFQFPKKLFTDTILDNN